MYNFLMGLFNWDAYIKQLREDCGLNDSKNRVIVPWSNEVAQFILSTPRPTKH